MLIRHIPNSIQSLKDEARRWLKALRAGDPEAIDRLQRAWPAAPAKPTLRQVQQAIAREQGMPSWADLKRQKALQVPPWQGLAPAQYEALAQDFVAAHDHADLAALQRLNACFQRAHNLEDLSADIWRRIYAYRQRASAGLPSRLLIEEARTMVAQDVGYGGWDQLLEATGSGSRPASNHGVDAQGRVFVRRRLDAGGWEALIERLEVRRDTSLMANGEMTDAALARLTRVESLTELSLEGSRGVTDAGLQVLADMPQLESLTLSGTRVTDRGLSVLARLPNLRRLQLSWQPGVTDTGIAHLHACEGLEVVNLMGTLTGDGALSALAGKPHLRELQCGRLVTDAGLAHLHRYPRFARWSGEPADPDDDDIAGSAASLLIDGPYTDAGVASLTGLDGLYHLDLFWHSTAITAAAFANLAGLANLGALGADDDLVDDTAMAHIAALPKLRRLRAQETPASDDGFRALARSATLESLWTRMAGPGGPGFAGLTAMPNLRRLGVSLAKVDDTALSALADMAQLRELTPIDLTDEGFRHVGRCLRLERLICMYCREVTDAATAQITHLNLRRYYAGLTQITDESLRLLAGITTLEMLELYETKQITDAGLAHLAGHPNLRRVSLSHLPRVTPKGVRALPARIALEYTP